MSTDLVVQDGDLTQQPPPAVTLVPQTTANDLVARLDIIRGAMQQAMQKDVDYGVIPGTGKKPTLLKPGAEKLAVLFQMDVQLANEKIWSDDGHLTVISRATVYHIPTGSRIASGEGMCSTREGKYAFRQSERVCPSCGEAAIIKGKQEYGGGFVCFKKKGGCGAKFTDNDSAITSQQTGQVPNPNIADTYNTVDKMASKRARVDAILAATGASALFTQDVEDFTDSAGEPTAERPATASDSTPVASASPVSQATSGEPASPADDDLPEPLRGDPADAKFITDAQAKKLNLLVGKLRAADRDPTGWIYSRFKVAAAMVDARENEDRLHWSAIRPHLSRIEATDLIDKLEEFVAKLEATSA